MAPADGDAPSPPSAARQVLDLDGVDALIALLHEEGFDVVGPTVEDATIDYRPVHRARDLPIGWTDDQAPGRYRANQMRRDGSAWVFGFATAAQSPKRWLFPPDEPTITAIRTPDGAIDLTDPARDERPLAVLGVRACELHAIDLLDRALLDGPHADAAYARRRARALLVAVECGHPSGTCFCDSMGTGPSVEPDSVGERVADLVLSELPPAPGTDDHEFVVRAASPGGARMLAHLPRRTATTGEIDTAKGVTHTARRHMGRTLDTDGLRERLYANTTHPAWELTAERCLSCGNCTMACPTCFCTSTRDTSDVAGLTAERWRSWESCFSLDFSYLGGGSVRTSPSSRYRQWVTHKLAAWFDQFDDSGCVGCGRCITWCPTGIDITDHVTELGSVVQGNATLLGTSLAEA